MHTELQPDAEANVKALINASLIRFFWTVNLYLKPKKTLWKQVDVYSEDKKFATIYHLQKREDSH
jgi:predicted metal-dependent enzyme (double-stranded beta helix superfamily)